VFRITLIALVVLTATTLIHATIEPAEARLFFSEFFLAGWRDWQYWLGLVVFVPLTFTFLLIIVLLSVAFIPISIAAAIVLYSQLFLVLALGRDTFVLAIATEIAAEPNPPRPSPVLVHVDPGDVDMRHSVHAMSAARTRLVAWIRERQAAGPPSSAQ
jgi:hypothetical protein